MNINFNHIRPINGSLHEGFEEFVTQLARNENITDQEKFIRKGKPDAGLECLWVMRDDSEIGWQAKFFTSSLVDSQWNQIDSSIKTVIGKHPRIRELIIAIPVDPPDARIKGQTSMLDKWNTHVEKWGKWAQSKGLSIKFTPWWLSDLLERLTDTRMQGLVKFWFNREFLTDDWIKEKNNLAIKNIGERYTPEINYELDIINAFNGISSDSKFKQVVLENFTHYYKAIDNSLPSELVQGDESYENILKILKNEIKKLTSNEDINSFEELQSLSKDLLLNNIQDLKNLIAESVLSIKTKIDKSQNQEEKDDLQYNQEKLLRVQQKLGEWLEFINDNSFKSLSTPCLLITGEAGVGKSHLLADLVLRRDDENKQSIFLLGQQINSDINPEQQILSNLDLQCSFEEFLTALNAKAQVQGSRIIIVIDAINEARGKSLWLNYLNGFVAKFFKYRWLGLILSLRSSYLDLFSENLKTLRNNMIIIEHHGFKSQEHAASRYFFSKYGIELPSVPLFNPEFSNPLFLKLLCEGLRKKGLSRIPEGLDGIKGTFDFFINSIEEKMRREVDNYPLSSNLVQQSINKLVDFIITNNLEIRNIPCETAYDITSKVQTRFNISINLLDKLIFEGIFTKSMFDGVEVIYLTYERFSDHLIVDNVLNKCSKGNLREIFNEGGEWKHLFSESNFYKYSGLHEALTIQIPEKYNGVELFEVVKVFGHYEYRIAELFIKSLRWRKKEQNIREEVLNYINSYILDNEQLESYFWDSMIMLATFPNSFFNAYKTHEILFKQTLAERDSWWTRLINYWFDDDCSAKTLIDWAWAGDDKQHISDTSIELSLIMLSWLLVSSNRELRDATTKAMVCLLEERLHLATSLIKRFLKVNDPYVFERVLGSVYGAVLRSCNYDTKDLSEISIYIYEKIFNQEQVYPHVLAREYARGIIEHSLNKGVELELDISKVRPPYKSTFPVIPSDKEIANLHTEESGVGSIFRSMQVDASRDGEFSNYGDFGRYIFQSNFHDYEQLNPIDLKNIAIKRIFELGYSSELHGTFDERRGYHSRLAKSMERIGKKYQWIAMHELMAQVNDKYGDTLFERVSQGAWKPFIRDIDPTVVSRFNPEQNLEFVVNNEVLDWKENDNEWLEAEIDTILNFTVRLNLKDLSSQEWLILGNFISERENTSLLPAFSQKEKKVICHIKSFFVPKGQIENFCQWINSCKIAFDLPAWSNYSIFNREYYWSPAYKYYMQDSDYFDCHEQELITFKNNQIKVIPTTVNYFWEAECDFSKPDSRIDFYKPSKILFEYFDLQYKKNETYLYSPKGELKCFDQGEKDLSNNKFVFSKKALGDFLTENKLDLVWVCYGEKQLLNEDDKKYDLQDFRRAFTLKNNKILSCPLPDKLPSQRKVENN